MPGGHHPCCSVEHRAGVITSTQFGLTGRKSHPYRQLERPLRVHRRIHRRLRGVERSAHTITGVLEHKALVRLDRRTQNLVMGGQCCPHCVGIRLPPAGRTLHVGKQKGHHPRRSSRRHRIASAHAI